MVISEDGPYVVTGSVPLAYLNKGMTLEMAVRKTT